MFPKDAWPAMTLDRYALGQPDHPDNFCRWMEFVTTQLGSMRGGSARKHLIYFQAKTGEWWFDHKLYETIDEAWAAVHAGFVEAIRLAEAGQWAEIEQIASLRGGRALVNKTLATYFPDQLLPINSETHLRHFLKALGEPRASDPALATTTLNRLLLEDLRAVPELDGWSTKQLERLLYTSDLDPFMAMLPTGPIAERSELHRSDAVGLRRRARRDASPERGPSTPAARCVGGADVRGAGPRAACPVQLRLKARQTEARPLRARVRRPDRQRAAD